MANNMANGESLGELYARIGLNFDELENGFLEVERTLRQNLGRLNRENRIINLQTQIDLQGLDAFNDAERILEVRQRGLQRQIENQRQRLNLLSAQLQDTARTTGENSDATQRARIEFENARLSVARLESQLEELNNRNRDTNLFSNSAGLTEKFNSLASTAKNLGDIFGTVNDAVNNLIENFRELKNQSAAFNLPLPKIDDFARKIRLAGGDLDDVQGFLAGLSDALIKGETDDPEFLALQRYGETIFTATGQLKNYVEIWEAVHRAFLKAQAEGKEVEFLQMTGGESGVKDALQALENWDKASKTASQIFKANLDFSELEKADEVSRKLTEQMSELGKATSSVFQPFVTSSAESFFEILRSGTRILTKLNTEFGDLLKQSADLPAILFSPLEYYRKNFELEKNQSKMLWKASEEQNANLEKLFANSAGLEKAHAELKEELKKQSASDPFQQYAFQRTQDLKDAIADLRVGLDYESEYMQVVKMAELERERALRQIVVGDKERAAIEEKYRTDLEQAAKDARDQIEEITKETAAIQFEGTHSAYQKEIWEIEQWKQKALEDLGEYKDAIGDKNIWIEESAAIVANAAAKEAKAFEEEIDKIRNKTLTLQEKIFNMTHSEQDRDIYNLQKELDQLAREGIYSPQLLGQYANLGYAQIQQKAKNSKDYSKAPNIPQAQGVQVNFDGKGLMEILTPYQDFYGEVQAELQNYLRLNEMALKEQQAALSNFKTDFSDIGKHGDFSAMTQQLTELTQAAGAIAQEVTQKQQSRDINVNIGGISINLAGGYVFDDAMKARLTDDITSEVANAVKSAVEQGISQTNYSYAN